MTYLNCNLSIGAKLNKIAIFQCGCCAWHSFHAHVSWQCKWCNDAAHDEEDNTPSASREMPFRRVPLELPLSCSAQHLPSQNTSACFSDTALSLIQTLLALVLPTVSFSTPGLQNSVPVLGPAVTLSLSSSGNVSSSSAWYVPCCFLLWRQQTDHSPPTWLPAEASFSLSIK